MEFTVELGIAAGIALVIGALLFGAAAQLIGETRTGFEWLVDSMAAGLGALVASEFVTAWRTIEPVWDGLAVAPAVLGGLAVGLVVELVTRFTTGGTYSRPLSV